MGAQTAGEEPVAEGVLEDVTTVQSTGGEGARHDLRPDVHVLARIGDHDGLAGGTGGGVQTHHIPDRAGEETEGIGVAQVRLDREREFGDVRQAADGLRGQAALLHALAEQGDVLIGTRDHGAQAAQLHLLQALSGQEVRGAGRVKAPRGVVPKLGLHASPPRSVSF